MKRMPLILGILLSFAALSCEKLLLDPAVPVSPPPTIHASRLATLLDSLRYAMDLPALAVAIVTDTGIVDAQAVGCRRYGGPVNVTNNDQFHLGSCGKSFTSVLLAGLVDEGRLTWTTSLTTLFPEYATSMRQEYRLVTVRDILSHCAGFMRDADITPQSTTPKEQRAEIVAWALEQPPTQERGTCVYSNLGYVIAGAIAEKVTGRPYEDLIAERVTKPLGLTTAGIGQMGTAGLEDQPLQHTASHAPIVATTDAHLSASYNPAGGLYMSVGDWGRYIQWVLASEAGHQTLLKPETARAITDPVVSTGGGAFYAFGWGGLYYESWAAGKTLEHSGSNGYNYCTAILAPGRRFGVIVMTNQGAVGNQWLLGPAVGRLINFALDGR